MNKNSLKIAMVATGQARVIKEFNSAQSLDSYKKGEIIFYQLVECGKSYYRIWKLGWEQSQYYETCSSAAFKKSFQLQ